MTPLTHTHTHTHKKGDGERGASHWQRDGCHKWQPFVLVKYTHMLALQGRKAEAKGNNLFTCSVWLSKPWHCRNLLLFQVWFSGAQGGLSCWYKPPPTLAVLKISITANTLAPIKNLDLASNYLALCPPPWKALKWQFILYVPKMSIKTP